MPLLRDLVLLAACLCLSWCPIVEGAPDGATGYLLLKGYLGKEELTPAKQQLHALSHKPLTRLLIEVNSVSGDLNAVLDLATHIYKTKHLRGTNVVVYIDENAVGPAGTIPFLADELLTSDYVSWGAIPYGAEGSLPTNILRNRLLSLIPANHAHLALLQLMATAMTDPDLAVVDQQGWRIINRDEKIDPTARMISPKGETLVVNHQQLRALGLVTHFLSPTEFIERYRGAVVPTQAMMPMPSQKDVEGLTPDLQKRLAAHIVYNPNGPNRIGHILIDDRTGGITAATWLYVKSALDSYKKSKPLFIILELNTPGGEVYPAQQISDALKEMDTQYDIPVVAYINNWAISAGAMLAYSSRFITVAKDGSMGAAEPVLASAEGQMVAASEKVNSALRADFANRANFFGRNPLLAEGMVDKDLILVMRRGKVLKLDAEDQISTKGADRDVIIKPKGKLLTLSAIQLLDYGVADLILPPVKLEPMTEAQRESGQWPASQMALFKQPFFDQIPEATVEAFRPDWRVKFLAFLARPFVSSLLLMGLMIGFYMEMSSPGAALPGSVAIICLMLIMLSSYAQQAAGWLEVILLFAGGALLATEIFVLPTWGLLGFAGIVSLLIGLFGLMLPGLENVAFDVDTHHWNAAGEFLLERLAWLCGALVLSVVIILLLWRYVMPRFTSLSRLVLQGEQEASLGYYAGPDPRSLPQPGAKGVTAATLRPAGKILVDGRLYDAVSSGDFIEEGEPIVVARLDGGRIVVARCLREESSP